MVLPTSQAQAIASSLGGALVSASGATYVGVPCTTPEFSFAISFGGRAWPVRTDDLVLGSSGSVCILSILAMDLRASSTSNQLMSVIGVAFLKNVVSVFDMNGRVGFGAIRSATASTSGTTGAPITAAAAAAGAAGASPTTVAAVVSVPVQRAAQSSGVAEIAPGFTITTTRIVPQGATYVSVPMTTATLNSATVTANGAAPTGVSFGAAASTRSVGSALLAGCLIALCAAL